MKRLVILAVLTPAVAFAKGELVVNYDRKALGQERATSALLTLHPKKVLTLSGFLSENAKGSTEATTQELSANYAPLKGRLQLSGAYRETGPAGSPKDQISTFRTSLTAIRGLTFSGGFTNENRTGSADTLKTDMSIGLSLGGFGSFSGNRTEARQGVNSTRTYKLEYGKKSSGTNIALDAQMTELENANPDVKTNATLKVAW